MPQGQPIVSPGPPTVCNNPSPSFLTRSHPRTYVTHAGSHCLYTHRSWVMISGYVPIPQLLAHMWSSLYNVSILPTYSLSTSLSLPLLPPMFVKYATCSAAASHRTKSVFPRGKQATTALTLPPHFYEFHCFLISPLSPRFGQEWRRWRKRDDCTTIDPE